MRPTPISAANASRADLDRHPDGPPDFNVEYADFSDHEAAVWVFSHGTLAGRRRDHIVACVNACEGINPEAVPELLAACKAYIGQQERMVEAGMDEGPADDDLIESFARANAVIVKQTMDAIAKAEGGAA